ncbi:MAG: bifunctional oligoribonuclease/PAP phosphatase NrnA [Candidatus Cloacimonetes bacterium]|nr:bifunctional oligoribonuclease/PAP phosphatase NrnA [Candidatus Cloacimonadota bacterium]MBS3768368.1 bifunctional oligoribonuclease/PAP phosphatase NrnA [Candidatus Cloacimonadota bacterium]
MKIINKSQKEFLNALHNNKKFLLTTHINSDGDGLGAEAALFLYLNYLGKDVKIVNDAKPAAQYDFLNLPVETNLEYEDVKNTVLIIMDCNEIARINDCFVPYLGKFKKIIVIDHHRDPQHFQNSIEIIDHRASSVCEIVYLLLEKEFNNLPHAIRLDIYQAIYAGIIFDTNNFVNSNVSKTTYFISGEMIERGVDNTLSYRHIFEDKPNSKLKLLGETLSSLEEYLDGKVVFYMTTQEMLEKTDTNMTDANGFTKEVRPDGLRQVVVYIREIAKNKYRVSLRSKKLDVQKIAKKFDGGGHKLAAGFKSNRQIDELRKGILSLISKKLQEI